MFRKKKKNLLTTKHFKCIKNRWILQDEITKENAFSILKEIRKISPRDISLHKNIDDKIWLKLFLVAFEQLEKISKMNED